MKHCPDWLHCDNGSEYVIGLDRVSVSIFRTFWQSGEYFLEDNGTLFKFKFN